GRDEWDAGRESDARGPGARPMLEPLPQPLLPARSLGKHRDYPAFAAEPHRRLDRLHVAFPTPDWEGAGGAQEPGEDRVEKLRLGHEIELAAGPERDAERPGVEARSMVRRNDEAGRREVLEPVGPEAVEKMQRGPADRAREEIERPHCHGPQYLD